MYWLQLESGLTEFSLKRFSKELEEIERDFPSHNVAVLFQPLCFLSSCFCA
jgi:hypothetical protein